MLTIENEGNYRISLLHLGFRPFFLAAGSYAAIGMGVWAYFYYNRIPFSPSHIPALAWHAHEMIYGYVMAVISGFLLTSVRNWTGMQTLRNGWLLGLVLLWLAARVLSLATISEARALMAAFDIAFNLALITAIGIPLVKARQWKQMSIWSKLWFLLAGNAMFYAGLFGWLKNGVQLGLYTGLFILLSLILLMGRRVIPFFIEKRTAADHLVNRKWVDLASLVLVLVFLVVEVYWPLPRVAGITAWLLFALHLLRMAGWYTRDIWKSPMLWVLYLGYGWLVLAFLLRGLMMFLPIDPMWFAHAIAAGGIGMITLGMMARVSLGHTGREVYRHPPVVGWAFALVGIAAVFRVLLPMAMPASTRTFVLLSQLGWIAGFSLFVFVYLPYLVQPRVDGRYG